MKALRKLKAVVLIFALLAMFAGGFTIMSTEKAEASWGCCIWVMYCPTYGPGPCWCECIPVPCW